MLVAVVVGDAASNRTQEGGCPGRGGKALHDRGLGPRPDAGGTEDAWGDMRSRIVTVQVGAGEIRVRPAERL